MCVKQTKGRPGPIPAELLQAPVPRGIKRARKLREGMREAADHDENLHIDFVIGIRDRLARVNKLMQRHEPHTAAADLRDLTEGVDRWLKLWRGAE